MLPSQRRPWDGEKSEASPSRMLFALLLASLAAPSVAWTAFADKAAMPTIEGTSLRNDLILPVLNDDVDFCVVAKTSFDKASLVCGMNFATPSPGTCLLACGASWNSALREAWAVINTGCTSLENAANDIWGPPETSKISSTGLFTASEWQVLRTKCIAICGSRWCDYLPNAPNALSLYPPREGVGSCPMFKATDGMYNYPFLTWNSVMYYEAENLGCTGGLSVIADDQFTTWACVHAPLCDPPPLGVADNLACYKYNRVRGEFIFWGWNSMLKLMPPLFQMPASFCNDDGTSVLINARQSTGTGLPLGTVMYKFYISKTTGELGLFRYGSAVDLSDSGCGPVRLAPNTRYWLEVVYGLGYYSWRGWWSSLNEDILRGNPQEISLALYPVLTGDKGPGFYGCDWLGITLQWCISDPMDLDLYMFAPLVKGGDFKLEEANAIYWATQIQGMRKYKGPFMQNEGEEKGGATIKLERDDTGQPEGGGPRSYGPESLIVKGSLMPGRYGVFATIFLGDPPNPLVFTGGCASVGIYSGSKPEGLLEQVSVGAKGKSGYWWHVLNVLVVEDPGATPNAAGKKPTIYSVEMVDKIVTGPAIGNFGDFGSPKFEVPLQASRSEVVFRREVNQFSRATETTQWMNEQHCKIYCRIGLAIFSATTSVRLQGTFVVTGGTALLDAKQALLVNKGPLGYSGGYATLEGTHSWLIQSDGYAPYVLNFKIGIGVDHLFFSSFLLPADGKTRVVLRWGDTPQDNDLYIRPLGVVNPTTGEAAVWAWKDGFTGQAYEPAVFVEGQSPYLFWNVAKNGCIEPYCLCECVDFDEDPDTPCQPLCTMSVLSEKDGEGPALSLDLDDQIHGAADPADGLVYNAPEVATLSNLWPGIYRVNVNAYPPDGDTPQFQSEVSVDIWLGDGLGVSLIDTVTLRAGRGGKWLYAGYIAVSDEGSSCTRANQKLQKPPGLPLCYSWFNVNRQLFNPLLSVNVPVRIRMSHALYMYENFAERMVDFSKATYTVYQGGSCTCVGVIECICTGSTVISTGIVGKELPASSSQVAAGYYTGFLPIFLANGKYQFVVRLSEYYDRLINVQVVRSEATSVFASMVPRLAVGEMRAVLAWGLSPFDLDLYVIRKSDPPAGRDKRVFWQQKTAPVPTSGVYEMEGIRLDRDWVEGYGPETITFSSATKALSFWVGVNVFATTTPDDELYGQCFFEDEDTCRFLGGELVEFYDSSGLITSSTFPAPTATGAKSTWWRVASVEKNIAGNYKVDLAQGITDGTASCVSVMYPECVEDYNP